MQNISDYNKDESGLVGYADAYYTPKNKEELIEIIANAQSLQIPITFQGGKTGIVGASVPFGGHLINLSNLSSVLSFEDDSIEVEAGITLKLLNQYIQQKNNALFFPVNPTEELASLGGIIAMNARSFNEMKYGSIINYIEELTFISLEGKEEKITNHDSAMQNIIGSEGSLGAITKVKLSLIPKSPIIWGIAFFFEESKNAFSFVEAIKFMHKDFSSVEFIDKESIDLIEKEKKNIEKIKKIPTITDNYKAIVYIEIEKNTEEEIENCVEKLIEIAENNNSDSENAWIFEGYEEVQKMRDFRHAIMEILLYNQFNFPFNLEIQGNNYGKTIDFIKEKLPTRNLFFFGHADNDRVFCMTVSQSQKELDTLLRTLENIFDLAYKACNSTANAFISEYGIGKKNKYFAEKYFS